MSVPGGDAGRDRPVVGIQCDHCRRRVVYVYPEMMRLWARPGETIEALLTRMRCNRCGQAPSSEITWFQDGRGSSDWVCASFPVRRESG